MLQPLNGNSEWIALPIGASVGVSIHPGTNASAIGVGLGTGEPRLGTRGSGLGLRICDRSCAVLIGDSGRAGYGLSPGRRICRIVGCSPCANNEESSDKNRDIAADKLESFYVV